MGGDESGMKWLVANYGPVVVVLYATLPFTEYTSGVYYDAGCPKMTANHAVVRKISQLSNHLLEIHVRFRSLLDMALTTNSVISGGSETLGERLGAMKVKDLFSFLIFNFFK